MIEQGSMESFVVYRSFVESIRKFHQLGVLTSDNVASLFYAMSSLALDGKEAELEPIEDAVFTQLRPQIVANREKASKGKQGGRLEAQVSIEELTDKYAELGNWAAVASFYGLSRQAVYNIRAHGVKQDVKQDVKNVNENVNVKKPNENVNENENENVKERVAQCAPVAAEPPALSVSENPSQTSVLFPTGQAAVSPQRAEQQQEKQKQQKSAAFVAPTVEEVAAYCKERNNGIDAEAFVAFYASKGWFVGKNKMKDWRQAVITWEKRSKEQAQNGARASPPSLQYKTWHAEDMPKISEEERAAVSEELGEIFDKLRQKTVAGG